MTPGIRTFLRQRRVQLIFAIRIPGLAYYLRLIVMPLLTANGRRIVLTTGCIKAGKGTRKHRRLCQADSPLLQSARGSLMKGGGDG
jgi:hypothetical protein